jgi:site-specific recombinase XerD
MGTYTEFLAGSGRSQNTIAEYQRRLKGWQLFLRQRGKALPDANQRDVKDFRDELLGEGQSPRTVNVKLSTIKSYYDWAVLEEKVEGNPVPNGLHLRFQVTRIHRLSDEDLVRVLHWFDGMQSNLRAAWYCLYASGARVGEVTVLRRGDVSLVNGAVYLDIKNAKWGSDRKVPLVDQRAAKIVYDYWREAPINGEPLFRVSKRTLQAYATAFSEETGISFWCHLLRHTFAARLLENGVPLTEIQLMLGHKSLSMTEYYTESARIDVSRHAPSVLEPV